jgi:hypothetical protein
VLPGLLLLLLLLLMMMSGVALVVLLPASAAEARAANAAGTAEESRCRSHAGGWGLLLSLGMLAPMLLLLLQWRHW